MMKLKQALAGVAAILVWASSAVAQPYGNRVGVMGGYGMGPQMGPVMMGGGYGSGPGMMAGCAHIAYAGLDLTAEQHKAIASIQEQASKAMWQLMTTVHGHGHHMQGMFGPSPLDEAEARKAFQAITEAQKAMFELQLNTRKKVDEVLTKDQREKLNLQWRGR